MKIPFKHILIILLLGTVSLFLHRKEINDFPQHIHAWAQSDYYAISLGFIDNGFDFFHPQTYTQNPQFPDGFLTPKENGITSADFPIHTYSVALLMKDGRIFVSGSGLCGKCTTNHLDAEIFTPPYLLKVDGTPAVRPVITESPSSARPGDDINVSVDKNGQHSFALVRLSSATHAVNNDERRIPLKAVKLSAGKFKLTIPASPAVVLPGNYFLFALNKNGVPGVAKILLINNK